MSDLSSKISDWVRSEVLNRILVLQLQKRESDIAAAKAHQSDSLNLANDEKRKTESEQVMNVVVEEVLAVESALVVGEAVRDVAASVVQAETLKNMEMERKNAEKILQAEAERRRIQNEEYEILLKYEQDRKRDLDREERKEIVNEIRKLRESQDARILEEKTRLEEQEKLKMEFNRQKMEEEEKYKAEIAVKEELHRLDIIRLKEVEESLEKARLETEKRIQAENKDEENKSSTPEELSTQQSNEDLSQKQVSVQKYLLFNYFAVLIITSCSLRK